MSNYVLNYRLLNLGDIILTREKQFISKAIRVATKGDYSHAMIVFREGSAVEANKLGVNSTVINRHIFKNLDDAIVLRYSSLTQEQQTAIVEYCSKQTGNRYSYKEAFWAWRPEGLNVSKKQFCSRLVARAYMKAGIQLCDHIDNCSPADLQRSGLLTSVDGCMSKASKQNIAHAATPDPSLDQSIRTHKFMKNVWSKYPDYTYDSIWLELQRDNFSEEFDKFVAESFKEAGLHELWKILKSYKLYLYNTGDYVAYCDREIDLINQDPGLDDIIDRNEFYRYHAQVQRCNQILPLLYTVMEEHKSMVQSSSSKALSLYLSNLESQIQDWILVVKVLEEVEGVYSD